MERIVDAPWANEGRRSVEAAIREWNETPGVSPDDRLHVAWGYSDTEHKQLWESSADGGEPDQLGLISLGKKETEIRIFQSRESGFPPHIRLTVPISYPQRLPLGAKTLFNIIELCQLHSCEMRLSPNPADDSMFIQMLACFFYASGMTGNIFHERVENIIEAAGELDDYLSHGVLVVDFWEERMSLDGDDEIGDE